MASMAEDYATILESIDPTDENVVAYLMLKPANRNFETFKTMLAIESIKQITLKFLCELERYGVCIFVFDPDDVEKLLALKELSDGTPVSITMHPHRNVTRRVVNVSGCGDLTDEEIQRELAPQGVTDVRRITKTTEDGQKKNTSMLVLSYARTVRKLKTAKLGTFRLRTLPYYPDVQQCFKCWEFGHIKPVCPQDKPICGICSGPHEMVKGKVCRKKPFCQKCQSGEHPISSRKCPKYQIQREILHIRIDKDLSYWRAKEEYEEKAGRDKDLMLSYLSSKVTNMKADLERKDCEIKILRAIYETMKRNEAKGIVHPNSKPEQKNAVDESSKGSKTGVKTKQKPSNEEEVSKSTEEDQSGNKTGEGGTTRRKKKGKKGRGK